MEMHHAIHAIITSHDPTRKTAGGVPLPMGVLGCGCSELLRASVNLAPATSRAPGHFHSKTLLCAAGLLVALQRRIRKRRHGVHD